MKAYCYYCCYRGLPPVDIIFSCPDTITFITVAKTLIIIANPGCFPWTSQAKNYSPNRKCPSDSPPPRSSWIHDSPPFSSLRPRESVRQWVPKTRVSTTPPPPPHPGVAAGRNGRRYCTNIQPPTPSDTPHRQPLSLHVAQRDEFVYLRTKNTPCLLAKYINVAHPRVMKI